MLRMDYSLKRQKAIIGFRQYHIEKPGSKPLLSARDTWHLEHQVPVLLLTYRKDRIERWEEHYWDNKEPGNKLNTDSHPVSKHLWGWKCHCLQLSGTAPLQPRELEEGSSLIPFDPCSIDACVTSGSTARHCQCGDHQSFQHLQLLAQWLQATTFHIQAPLSHKEGTVTTQDGGSNQQVRQRTRWGRSEKDVKAKEQYAHVFSHPQHCDLVLQQKSVPHCTPCCASTRHEGGGVSPKLSPDRLLSWLKAGKSEIIKHSPDSPSDSLL